MGRIKGTLVKRLTKELLDKYRSKFTTNFDENKKVMKAILIPPKKIRNSVAGFITRKVKKEELAKKKKK